MIPNNKRKTPVIMSNSIVSQVSATVDKDALSIIGASDDRELLAQGKDDFLPYEFAYDCIVELIEVKARKEFDSRGVFVKLSVVSIASTESPTELKVGKTYTLAFFDAHKTLPEFVLGQMVRSRKAFAAAVEGVEPTEEYKAAPTLLQLHREVEPLGIQMRFTNVYQRSTRNGKKIHTLNFALAQ